MKPLTCLATAMFSGAVFCSVDVSCAFNVHADAETLRAFVGVLGGVAVLVGYVRSRKRG